MTHMPISLKPYWWDAAPRPSSQGIEIPERADVGIIGAGFTGLSAALELARAGLSVVVVDALSPGEGASSRNGGICSGNIKLSFSEMVSQFGLDEAKRIFSEGVTARESLAELIQTESIDCGFKLTGRFTSAMRSADYNHLGREADLLNKHLDLGVEMVPHAEQHRELGTDAFFGGQVRPDIGGLHPGLFVNGLYQRAVDAGAKVIFPLHVSSVARQQDKFVLTTANGNLQVDQVIVATNGYSGPMDRWLQRRIIPIPSQIIATEPLPQSTMARLMPKGRMLGNTRNLYNYFRPSPDGTRILFGGRIGAHTDDPEIKTRHLKRQLIESFPELKEVNISHSWWGYTGYSFDMFPHLAQHNGIHYACAYCGSGVVWAPWLGRRVAHRILGRDQQGSSVFDRPQFPTRPLYTGRPWFLPMVIGWYGLLDRFGKGRMT